jgi:hypothetical protein
MPPKHLAKVFCGSRSELSQGAAVLLRLTRLKVTFHASENTPVWVDVLIFILIALWSRYATNVLAEWMTHVHYSERKCRYGSKYSLQLCVLWSATLSFLSLYGWRVKSSKHSHLLTNLSNKVLRIPVDLLYGML